MAHRIFLYPSDLMLLEGINSKNTAIRHYKLILASLSKNESAKLTVEEYAKDQGISAELVYEKIPATPHPYKYFK